MTDRQAKSVRHDRNCRTLSRRKCAAKYAVDGQLMAGIAPPVGRPENSTGQSSLPISTCGKRKEIGSPGRNLFGQVDEKQGLSGSIGVTRRRAITRKRTVAQCGARDGIT